MKPSPGKFFRLNLKVSCRHVYDVVPTLNVILKGDGPIASVPDGELFMIADTSEEREEIYKIIYKDVIGWMIADERELVEVKLEEESERLS